MEDKKIEINVIGLARSGKSVIIGLIHEALKDESIINNITITDTEMAVTESEYTDRARKIADSQDINIDVVINQKMRRR